MTAEGSADAASDGDVDGGTVPDALVVSPPLRLTAVAGGALVAALVALVLADAGGRLLLAPVVVGTVALLLRDLVGGPVLRADGSGIEVLTGWRRVGAEWRGVERLRMVKDRRTRVLEVDLGTAVVALSGTRLGRHPDDVLHDLEELRARGTP